jgi:hypothetical protein
MLKLLHLPLFLPTFLAVLFRPVHFFRYYHNLVVTREESFWDLNSEQEGDPYLSPVKFSALAIFLSNLIFPMILTLGVQVGAVDPGFAEFADWAKQQGHLDPLAITGIGFIDDFLRELLLLLVFYGLGVSIAWLSGRRVPARFAAGYFFYWNAWSLLGALVSFALILVSLVIPLYQTGLPTLIDVVISIAGFFMFLGFPIFFWPKIMHISRSRMAWALAGGLIIWIILLAIISPLIVDMPEYR